MALRLGALQDALLDAGASAEQATRAAEELADYDRQLAAIRTDLSVLKWMVGTNVVLTVAILIRLWVP